MVVSEYNRILLYWWFVLTFYLPTYFHSAFWLGAICRCLCNETGGLQSPCCKWLKSHIILVKYISVVRAIWRAKLSRECKVKAWLKGGSPGLVVMGDGTCLRGRGFESRRHILDGHFSHWFVVKFVLFVWKDQKYTKRGRVWLIF